YFAPLTALTWADGQTDDRRQKNPRLEASRLSPLWARPCVPHICSLGCLPPSPALSQLALECQEPTGSLRGLELSRSEHQPEERDQGTGGGRPRGED
ncbi:mCG140975, partial [Mus musculus]